MSASSVRRGKRINDPAEREAFKQQRRQEEREAIEASVRALMESDGWRRWVESRQRFHNYSLCNTLLIASQMPDATQVAGYRTWQSIGRQVRKGERGIRIMAPMRVSHRKGEAPAVGISDSATIAQTVAAKRDKLGEVETLMLFRAVSVFDVSQTDGAELPDCPREPIEGDSHAEYLPRLERFAAELGYTVRYGDTGPAGGWCDVKRHEIVVATAGSPNAKVRTLVHEIAHALGVDYTDYSREDAEVIVETAAIIACGSLGLDTAGESLPYIAGWGQRSDLAAMRQCAAKVDECASRIEAALGVRS